MVYNIANYQADGLLGLAFQSMSVFGAPPVFQTLIAENVLDNSTFALKLNTSVDSEIFLGGANRDLYTGDITWISLTEEVCHTHYSVKYGCKRDHSD
jgi:cathepsin D